MKRQTDHGKRSLSARTFHLICCQKFFTDLKKCQSCAFEPGKTRWISLVFFNWFVKYSIFINWLEGLIMEKTTQKQSWGVPLSKNGN